MIDLNQYIGKPFAWNARGPDAYDCWGLVRAVLGQYGIVVPDYLYAPQRPAAVADLVEYVAGSQPLWAPVEDPGVGDVIMMGTSPRLHHAGVFTEHGVIHTSLKTGVLIQPLHILQRTMYRCTRSYRWAG